MVAYWACVGVSVFTRGVEKLSQATVLLNSGHDIDVIPVQGCDEYLCRILGEMPAKPAVPTLCVLDGTNGDSFVAVYVGDRHIGYLPHPADPELIRILRECSQRGATARARGKLIASWGLTPTVCGIG